jgi:hypothetical protein
MGSTFAERAAARAGKSSFTAPEIENGEAVENTTFAARAKQVDGAENKAVKSSSSKSAKKS